MPSKVEEGLGSVGGRVGKKKPEKEEKSLKDGET